MVALPQGLRLYIWVISQAFDFFISPIIDIQPWRTVCQFIYGGKRKGNLGIKAKQLYHTSLQSMRLPAYESTMKLCPSYCDKICLFSFTFLKQRSHFHNCLKTISIWRENTESKLIWNNQTLWLQVPNKDNKSNAQNVNVDPLLHWRHITTNDPTLLEANKCEACEHPVHDLEFFCDQDSRDHCAFPLCGLEVTWRRISGFAWKWWKCDNSLANFNVTLSQQTSTLPICDQAICPPLTMISGLAPKKPGFHKTKSASFPTY